MTASRRRLGEYVEHHNLHRPRRSLGQIAPSNAYINPDPITNVNTQHLRRSDALDGLIHEYLLAA